MSSLLIGWLVCLFLFVKALLSAHDTVAQKDFEPTLPPLPDNIPENEEAMRIVCLVKNNQPLVRELSDVCQIILTYTSIDNASHAYWFLSRNVTDIVCILVQFFTKSQELLWLERALRPSSPAQCGYN